MSKMTHVVLSTVDCKGTVVFRSDNSKNLLKLRKLYLANRYDRKTYHLRFWSAKVTEGEPLSEAITS